VKPAPFDYVAPKSLDEALAILAERGDEAKILAGGQSLIPVLNFRLAQPALLVDLNGIAELGGERAEADGGITFGALRRHREVERSTLVAERAPLLAEAMPHVAHPQIRSRGTLGGSLAHADPAAELPAIALALDFELRLRSRDGERRLAARDFFTGFFTTALEPGEVVTEVRIPPRPAGTGFAFLEIARRHGDYAQAGVAARVAIDAEGRCREARLVFLAVGPGPVEAHRAAAAVEGGVVSDELFAEAGRVAAAEDVDPTGDLHASAEFKRHLVAVLTKRALSLAARRVSAPRGATA
jgi:carbon-monoxide dehydrogenase medium subunit